MALKLTVTPSTNYIEDSINVKITGGTIPRTAILFVFLATTPPSPTSGGYVMEVTNLKADNNITISSNILSQIYSDSNWKNTAKTYVEFDLEDIYEGQQGTYTPIAKAITKTMYIKPEPPTFDITPTYEDINSDSFALTNDNQIIVNGLSDIRVSNIHGTAHKGGDIVSININGNVSAYNNTVLLNNFNDPVLSLNATLIDSRGWKSETKILAYASKFKYSYLPPTVEASAERDGITEIAKIKANGYYLEGYQRGANPLINSYKWQEIGSGVPETTGETTLTIIKEPTTEWTDFNNIIDEFENPNYLYEDNIQYYTGTQWNSGINDLFYQAIKYNNKYTQEYLQIDYDNINDRYRVISGGYNGSWRNFWLDTIKALYRVMYGDKRTNAGDNGNGGNYEWHIEETAIKGDLPSGFSINSSYYINYYMQDNISDSILRTLRIGTAIPAIDVFKDKIALHGLFDENIDADIQLNGKVALNGEPLFGQEILWEGATFIRDQQELLLSKNVSNMKHGIVLVFSGYSNDAEVDNNFECYFVPKYLVSLKNGVGHMIFMGGTNALGCKYIYIYNNKVRGHSINNISTTISGVSYNNRSFVLRYIIGV